MFTDDGTNTGPDGEQPIGVNSRQVLLRLLMLTAATILLLVAIRYVFL